MAMMLALMACAPKASVETNFPPGQRPDGLANVPEGPVLLSFWASWCPPCYEEFPHLQTLHDEGIPVVAISLDAPEAQDKAAQAMEPYTFPWFQDQGLAPVFYIAAIPSNVVYDERGRAVYSAVETLSPDDVRAHF